LAISAGWMLIGPTWIQRAAPPAVRPKPATTITSRPTAPARIG
jgi:hypothetical protein